MGLRLLVDAPGKPLVTWQELAGLVGSANRQAASQHVEDFRQSGEDVRAFILRKRKVDAAVVDGVWHELLPTPLAGPTELVPRVNGRWGRHDLTAANSEGALEQISCVPVRRTLRRQLEAGHVQYQEAWLLTERLESRSTPAVQGIGWSGPSVDRGRQISDHTALAALVMPDVPLERITDSLCGLTFLMTLFSWNVPVAVFGRWCGVQKTTLLRWVLGLALALWPLVSQWIGERVKAQMVYVDEKGLKIRGRWHYWVVVLEVTTELPVLAALLPSRSQWACRWVGAQLRQLKKIPRMIITDGLQAYAYLVPAAKHVLCRFHHQQGVTHWLEPHLATEAEINTRKPVMKKVLRTRDKRTVRRRLARLRERAPALGITPWGNRVEAQLPPAYLQCGPCACALDHACAGTLLPGLPAVLPHPWGFLLGPPCQTGASPLARRLCVYAACHHRPSAHRSDRARGAADAPLPFDQRSLPGAPGAGSCQANGHDGRFAVGHGSRSLGTRRGNHATLTPQPVSGYQNFH